MRTGEQAHDLAYAFHNLPVEIHGWGTWSVAGMRGRFRHYQHKHKANLGVAGVGGGGAVDLLVQREVYPRRKTRQVHLQHRGQGR